MKKVTFTLGRAGMTIADFPSSDEAMNAVKERKGFFKGLGESYEWDKDGTVRKFTIAWVEEAETQNLFAVDPQCMRSDVKDASNSEAFEDLSLSQTSTQLKNRQ